MFIRVSRVEAMRGGVEEKLETWFRLSDSNNRVTF